MKAAVGYALLFLCILLSMVVICRPSRRKAPKD